MSAVKPSSVFDAEPLRPDHTHIFAALSELNTKVGELTATVGKPGTPDGGLPASGIFAHLSDHTKRITRFERLWERALGVAVGSVPMFGALWWLAGDKIEKLLHG